jgi:membrane associated rhomboid family serine protease
VRPAPPIARVASYPVVGGLAILAVMVSLAWMTEQVDVDPVVLDVRAIPAEPWRLLTSALPHVGLLHLGFNVYWLWNFGTHIEEVFGHGRTLLILAFFAAGSGAAEYALSAQGGVGLSGVGYGLFGMTWWLARYDSRFAGAMDTRTTRLFGIWFLLCILLTAGDWMPVANVAHGMGWALGLAMGAAITGRGGARAAWAGLSLLLATLSLTGATVLRPWVNLSAEAGTDSARLAYLALLDGRNQVAVDHLERALQFNESTGWWNNLGIAYGRLGRQQAAARAFARAKALDENR